MNSTQVGVIGRDTRTRRRMYKIKDHKTREGMGGRAMGFYKHNSPWSPLALWLGNARWSTHVSVLGCVTFFVFHVVVFSFDHVVECILSDPAVHRYHTAGILYDLLLRVALAWQY